MVILNKQRHYNNYGCNMEHVSHIELKVIGNRIMKTLKLWSTMQLLLMHKFSTSGVFGNR